MIQTYLTYRFHGFDEEEDVLALQSFVPLYLDWKSSHVQLTPKKFSQILINVGIIKVFLYSNN